MTITKGELSEAIKIEFYLETLGKLYESGGVISEVNKNIILRFMKQKYMEESIFDNQWQETK